MQFDRLLDLAESSSSSTMRSEDIVDMLESIKKARQGQSLFSSQPRPQQKKLNLDDFSLSSQSHAGQQAIEPDEHSLPQFTNGHFKKLEVSSESYEQARKFFMDIEPLEEEQVRPTKHKPEEPRPSLEETGRRRVFMMIDSQDEQ